MSSAGNIQSESLVWENTRRNLASAPYALSSAKWRRGQGVRRCSSKFIQANRTEAPHPAPRCGARGGLRCEHQLARESARVVLHLKLFSTEGCHE
jgi:hypothetical protein